MDLKYYKPFEVARMLGISKERLLDSERQGTIAPSLRDENGIRVYTVDQIEEIRDRVGLRPTVENPPRVVAVFNMKGGVGKSTLTANLAVNLAERGFRILGMDADPQGHLTASLGQEPSSFGATLLQLLVPDRTGEAAALDDVRQELTPNLHLIPANLSLCDLNLLLFQQPEREYRLRRTMEQIRNAGSYDVVLIDSPPSYDLTSLNILLACDLVIAPVKLDGNSFYGLEYLFDTIRKVGRVYRYRIPAVVIVPNYYNGNFAVSRQVLKGLRAHYEPYLARTVIRQDVNFDKANALRQTIFQTAPSSRGSKDVNSLSGELVGLLTAREEVRGTTQS
ncbi:MAG: AAA family ATPase [Desulfomonile tiedjei]|nr:AAA family ATPase [Desulfomonile tiedjei]